MKAICCHICLIVLLLTLYTPGATARDEDVRQITACGTSAIIDNNIAAARSRSLRNAQRHAVEMGVGTFIGSKTIIEKDELLTDRIYSRASGYITSWEPVSENILPNGHTYRVCINAFVKAGHIENDLKELSIPMILQHAGDPIFLAVYHQKTDAAAPPDASIVAAVESALQNIFVDNQFQVLKNASADQTRRLIDRIGIHNILAGRFSTDMGADMLIVYSVSAKEKKWLKSKHFAEYRLDVNMQAVDTTTARIISTVPKTYDVRTLKTNKPSYYDNDQLVDRASRMATSAAIEMAKETLDHFNDRFLNGAPYFITFNSFDPYEMAILIDVIENLNGFRSKTIRHQYTDSTIAEIIFAGQSFDLYQQLNAALQKKNIPIEVPASNNNTFIIEKP